MVMDFIEVLKIIFLGIIEGVTEWLPVSSTGHMLLVDQFIHLKGSEAFKETFFIVIQLGAILAVIVAFFNKMVPIKVENGKPLWKKETLNVWLKVIVACIPGVIAVLFDDVVESYLHGPYVIATALIVYGVLFIIIEKTNKTKTPKITSLESLSFKTAFLIGLFQVLAIIPGTSRSGATIIGALILGVSRTTAAEFTFFLAVPVMLGYSLLKIVKFLLAGGTLLGVETLAIVIGSVVAFLVSLLVVKLLMAFVKKNTFIPFGVYRIILGAVVVIYFLCI
ncbi:MAG: undecaprenyl-diphosphate phosphatase [Clostridia bacterium]|nr:undecaprenyl-diphosphate phosphatase [Clostridia bacterium]